MKKALESQGAFGSKKLFNMVTLLLLFYEIFCNVHGLPGRGFPVPGGQLMPYFLNVQENHSWVKVFNCSKFHWNWSNVLEQIYTQTLSFMH
jgi:hypothetical protein